MGAGHRQHVAALQYVFGQPLRPAHVRGTTVKDGFHQRKFCCAVGQVHPRDHIADHKHVGFARQLRQLVGSVPFDQFNAQRAQLVTHRRVDAGVTTRHCMSRLSCQCREAPHEGAANPQNMYVHDGYFRHRRGCAQLA